MQDGELIASFEPGESRYVVVFAFDDLADAFLLQDRATRQLTGWTDEGERYDRVETVAIAQAAVGRRLMVDGRLMGVLLVSTADSDKQIEQARRQWQSSGAVQEGLALDKMALPDPFAPSLEQNDFFDKWTEEAVSLHPAGGASAPSVKMTDVRKAFNVYVKDYGRPDLRFVGSSGGRTFSALVKRRYGDDVERVEASNNRVYIRGLTRREGARAAWFPALPRG